MNLLQKQSWFIIFLILFIPLYLFRLRSLPVYQIPQNVPVRLQGRVSKPPYLKGSYQIIYLGPVLVKTNRFPEYFYNQKIEVIGKFEKRVINFFQAEYFANFPTIRLVEDSKKGGKELNLRVYLLMIKGRLERIVGELLPEPQSSLLLGIVFGSRRQMPQEFWQNLRKTGTLHIVVASGQNVSLVGWFLIEGLTWIMSRQKALVAAIIGVGLYVLMVGAEAPVLRAGIMAVVAFTAQFLGREKEETIALLVAASLISLISPLIPLDIGFQLSFAATAGLIWIKPLLSSGMAAAPAVVQQPQRNPDRILTIFPSSFFGEALKTTIAAQLAVLPIILVNFGQVSFLSPLVNALVLWTVPPVMVLGSAVALGGLILRPVAQVLGWFVWLLLSYFVKIVELAGKLPLMTTETGRLSGWWVAGYYGVLIFFIIRGEIARNERVWIA